MWYICTLFGIRETLKREISKRERAEKLTLLLFGTHVKERRETNLRWDPRVFASVQNGP